MMNPSNRQQSAHDPLEIVRQVASKGIQLWSENGQLRYRAPKGSLTRDDIERLAASREQILVLLREAVDHVSGAEQPLEPRKPTLRVPLTFSQLAHWRCNRLYERPSVRQVASAIRISGPLNLELLCSSVSATVRRHEALRTRIIIQEGVPVQDVSEAEHSHLTVEDFAGLVGADRQVQLTGLIERLILEPVRLDRDPLWAIALARFDADEHVLIVAMEHMIGDGVSINILLRDLFAQYDAVLRGTPVCLPAIPIQFADYAVWQSATREQWLCRHGEYWRRRLAGSELLRFPAQEGLRRETARSWNSVQICIDADLKAQLRDWCRIRQTTLVMSVLTAYIALLARWCTSRDVVLRYQTDGRSNPKITQAIGYFASILYLRIELRDSDTLLDLLERVVQEYCSGQEHADSSYLDTQTMASGLVQSPGFNWVPQEPKHNLAHAQDSPGALRFSPVPFDNPVLRRYERNAEPTLLLYDFDEQIVGSLLYQADKFAPAAMRRWADNFLSVMKVMLRQPDRCLRDIHLL